MSFYYDPVAQGRPVNETVYRPIANFAERFAYYGSGGLLDPKMPAEAYYLRTGSFRGITTRAGWSALGLRGFAVGAGLSMGGAILAIGFAGAVLDPLNVNEGGLDEFYRPVWNRFERESRDVYFVS